MDELKRNGSGYYDETAYKAMKNYERKNTMKAGEIWEVDIKGKISEMLIVKEQNGFCNALNLFEDKLYENAIEVITTKIKYINPAMMQYIFNNRFVRKVMKMNDAEFKSIIERVYESLGMQTIENDSYAEADTQIVKELEEKLEDAYSNIESKRKLLEDISIENEKLKEKLDLRIKSAIEAEHNVEDAIKLETERDLYKRLYEQTLERLIAS